MAKTYDVMLVNAGDQKLRVVQVVRETCKLDLKDAKDKVDSCWLLDAKLKTVDSYDEAQRIKAVVEATGATVRIDTNGAEEQEDDIWNSVSVIPSKRNDTKSSTNAPHGYTVFLEDEGDDRDAMIEALMKHCGFSKSLAEEKTGFTLLLDYEPLKVKLSLEDAEDLVRKLERASSDAKLIINPSEADEEDPEDNGDEEVEEEVEESAEMSIDWDMIHGGTKYYCVLGGQSFGPVNIHQLTNMVTFGIVTRDTLVWTEGMSDWIPARSMPKVCNLVP